MSNVCFSPRVYSFPCLSAFADMIEVIVLNIWHLSCGVTTAVCCFQWYVAWFFFLFIFWSVECNLLVGKLACLSLCSQLTTSDLAFVSAKRMRQYFSLWWWQTSTLTSSRRSGQLWFFQQCCFWTARNQDQPDGRVGEVIGTVVDPVVCLIGLQANVFVTLFLTVGSDQN